MIAKRILDFVSHRANFFQGSNFSYSLQSPFQHFTTLEAIEQTTYKNQKEDEDFKKNNDEEEHERNHKNPNPEFNWVLPPVAFVLSSLYV